MYKRTNSSSNKITKKTFENNTKTKIQLIQPEPEIYLFAAEWWAECPVLVVFCFVFCLRFFFSSFVLFCFA